MEGEISVEEFRWNLKRLLREGFPRGIALQDLSRYYEYFQNGKVEPHFIIPGCDNWKTVFLENELLKQTFSICKNRNVEIVRLQGGPFVEEKSMQELEWVLRLSRYATYKFTKIINPNPRDVVSKPIPLSETGIHTVDADASFQSTSADSISPSRPSGQVDDVQGNASVTFPSMIFTETDSHNQQRSSDLGLSLSLVNDKTIQVESKKGRENNKIPKAGSLNGMDVTEHSDSYDLEPEPPLVNVNGCLEGQHVEEEMEDIFILPNNAEDTYNTEEATNAYEIVHVSYEAVTEPEKNEPIENQTDPLHIELDYIKQTQTQSVPVVTDLDVISNNLPISPGNLMKEAQAGLTGNPTTELQDMQPEGRRKSIQDFVQQFFQGYNESALDGETPGPSQIHTQRPCPLSLKKRQSTTPGKFSGRKKTKVSNLQETSVSSNIITLADYAEVELKLGEFVSTCYVDSNRTASAGITTGDEYAKVVQSINRNLPQEDPKLTVVGVDDYMNDPFEWVAVPVSAFWDHVVYKRAFYKCDGAVTSYFDKKKNWVPCTLKEFHLPDKSIVYGEFVENFSTRTITFDVIDCACIFGRNISDLHFDQRRAAFAIFAVSKLNTANTKVRLKEAYGLWEMEEKIISRFVECYDVTTKEKFRCLPDPECTSKREDRYSVGAIVCIQVMFFGSPTDFLYAMDNRCTWIFESEAAFHTERILYDEFNSTVCLWHFLDKLHSARTAIRPSETNFGGNES